MEPNWTKILPALKKTNRIIIQSEKYIHICDLDKVSIEFEFPAVKEFCTIEKSKLPFTDLHKIYNLKIEAKSNE